MALTTEALWAQFHEGLLRFVSRRVANPADAEDVVQRVFLQLHRALPTLRDDERVHAWVYNAARRAIIDFYRAAPRRREQPSGDLVDLELALPAATEDSSESALSELALCLRPLMGELSDADQQALALVEFDGVPQVEAARRVGVSVSGMKSRVQRARQRLRERVEACCRIEFDRRGGVQAYSARCESC